MRGQRQKIWEEPDLEPHARRGEAFLLKVSVPVGVVVALVLLAAAVGYNAFSCLCRAELAQTELTLRKVGSDMDAFRTATGVTPASLEVLTVPVGIEPLTASELTESSCAVWTPHLKPEDINDAWGQPLRLDNIDGGYELRSAGEGGEFGDEDDLVHVSPDELKPVLSDVEL